MEYKVIWEIEIDADSPYQAAQLALAIQQDQYSEALAFTVLEPGTRTGYLIDLMEDEDVED